jgi:hypothetical protein
MKNIFKKRRNKMKKIKNIGIKILGAMLLVASFSGLTKAANPTYLDIHVSINAVKDISVNTTFYYFGAQPINTSTNSATPIVVTNASSALIETYTIMGGDAISDTAGTDWTLANSTNSTAANTYALAAVFSGSRPNNTEDSWQTDDLNRLSAVTCTSTVLGNGVGGESGAGVSPATTRNLYFRLRTPTSVLDAGGHTATLTLSVL